MKKSCTQSNKPRTLRYWILLICFIFACNLAKEENTVGQGIVAKAYKEVLTLDEVQELIPDNSSKEDSLAISERYINSWLKEQVILHQAKVNLPSEQIQFEKELEKLRKSLISYAYESHYVEQRLDTLISQEEINTYYEGNKDIFRLKDYIVKVKYCILDSSFNKMRKFEKLFFSNELEDLILLEQFCVEQGCQFYLNTEDWKYFDELLQVIPLEVYNIEGFLKKNKTLSFEHDNQRYYVAVLDYEFKDDFSPKELVRMQIKDLILNRRKQELLNNMREQLYRSALSKQEIEKIDS